MLVPSAADGAGAERPEAEGIAKLTAVDAGAVEVGASPAGNAPLVPVLRAPLAVPALPAAGGNTTSSPGLTG